MQVILTKDVSFVDFDNKAVTIHAETPIIVDEEGVATDGTYHFDIAEDEYATLH